LSQCTDYRERVLQMSSMATVGNLNYLMILMDIVATASFIKHFLSNCLELCILLPINEHKGRFAMLQVFPQWPIMQRKRK
jgi:hypothetical protein